MKKIILFISLIFISFNSYSQKDPKQMDREIAKHLFDKGFERDEIRTTIVLVREMSKEIFEKKKLSKKTKKKIKSHSFSDEQVQILKSLSQKMSKIIGSNQKKDETRNNLSSRANGRNFSGGQRQGPPRGGQRFGPPSNRQGNTGAQTPNPVFVKLMEYVREQGVSRENIRDVMGSIQTIGQEYRSAADRSSFKPSDDTVKNLSDAGLSDESILIIVEIIKVLQ